jgi:serine O-acetyltransferase
MTFLDLVRTDLIQAKIISDKTIRFGFFIFIYYFFRSRTCRIHTFVRLRSKNKILAYLAKKYLARYFIEVGENTKIGAYFWMPHPRCIIIAEDVIIGEHVHIGQYVTIGGSFKKIKKLPNGLVQKVPIIGDRVMIHPGAVIGGPSTLGNDIIVGANAVVTKDVSSNTICFGQNQKARKKITIPEEGSRYEIKEK